ncbi:hypothetical protein CAAN1_15S00760 [[Candida] anglica]|uniref:FMN hydroxy acid dehydrogenase domain-containing protein n=1 Tax=[Candida] anglica TaxID=148631 RepID=A0ABP0ECC1_9ASCO
MTSDSPLIIYQGKAYPIDEVPANLATLLLETLTLRQSQQSKPSIDQIHSVKDFEAIAQNALKPDVWSYYRTGADDEITLRENIAAFQRIYFRPRILQNVSEVDQSTTMLGTKTSAPFYITAFAQSNWGHPLAEKNLTWAAGETNLIQMIPSMSGFPFDEIVDEATTNQELWLQIYVDAKREATEKLISRAQARGIKAIFFTVDTAQLGNRESQSRTDGVPFSVLLPQDPSLDWEDIKYYKSRCPDIKIILKGVQCVEDAVKAVNYGADGILISNHGGRQLDTSRSSIEVLAEIMPELKHQNVSKEFEVFIDGGVRRGTDIVKALCLGANGVGLGRPFLYAMSAYGKEGVIKAINVLKNEIDCCLRLLGVRSIEELHPGLIDVGEVNRNRTTIMDN